MATSILKIQYITTNRHMLWKLYIWLIHAKEKHTVYIQIFVHTWAHSFMSHHQTVESTQLYKMSLCAVPLQLLFSFHYQTYPRIMMPLYTKPAPYRPYIVATMCIVATMPYGRLSGRTRALTSVTQTTVPDLSDAPVPGSKIQQKSFPEKWNI